MKRSRHSVDQIIASLRQADLESGEAFVAGSFGSIAPGPIGRTGFT